MATLGEVIASRAYAAATQGKWQDVVDNVNAKDIPKHDNTRYTSAKLIKTLGMDEYDAVAKTLVELGQQRESIKDMHTMLCSYGLDFADAMTQAQIAGIGALKGWPPERTATILAIGVQHVSPVEEAGLPDATTETAQAAWAIYTLGHWLEDRRMNAISKINSGEISTLESLRSFIGSE